MRWFGFYDGFGVWGLCGWGKGEEREGYVCTPEWMLATMARDAEVVIIDERDDSMCKKMP